MKSLNSSALSKFRGLGSALKGLEEVHTFGLDLGFALGLLKGAKSRKISFHVDAAGYRPSELSPEEWHEIAGRAFHLVPKYKKGDVFHSKAWFIKRGVLLGSANLSIREARQNLNFWCWMPKQIGSGMRKLLNRNTPATYLWDLNESSPKLYGAPLEALQVAIGRHTVQSLIIATPQPPSKTILKELLPQMNETGTCVFFLNVGAYAVSRIPGGRKWQVHNMIPKDGQAELHGKALYAEWGKGKDSGAVLYVGSANFTRAAYSGDNVESGIVFRAGGEKAVRNLQDALLTLLGRSGKPCSSMESWATERFSGAWEKVEPGAGETERPPFRTEEDKALAEFVGALRANKNTLYFPSHYGGKKIVRAELHASDRKTNVWRHRAGGRSRKFSGVVWSADLQIDLCGCSTTPISVPPLEGLMRGVSERAGLLELLLTQYSNRGMGRETSGETGSDSEFISIYGNDPRVLFPWAAIIRGKHSGLLHNETELRRALEAIEEKLCEQEAEGDSHHVRKLENIAFTLKCLLNRKK